MNKLLIETTRLFIRQPTPEDLDYLITWLTDSETSKHVGGVRPLEKIKETMEKTLSNWKSKNFGGGIVVLKTTSEVIVICGISEVVIDEKVENDLGYLIDKKYWNQGFATEASRAMMDYGISILGMTRITAWPNKKNISSIKVAEKLGFKFEKEISEKHYGKLLSGMCLYIWSSST